MRLLTLNVMHAGPERADRIVQSLARLGPDVAVLTEVKPGQGTDRLSAGLCRDGFAVVTGLCTEAAHPYTTMIASRIPASGVGRPLEGSRFESALLEATIDGATVVALYAPLNGSLPGTRHDHDEFWRLLRPYADSRIGVPSIIAGDWNTGCWPDDIGGGRVPGMAAYAQLVTSGWLDAWRSLHATGREFSWYNRRSRNGFRIDHALLSPDLASSLIDAKYVHETRSEGLSDHSALIVELDS